jgi:hypothetical protein
MSLAEAGGSARIIKGSAASLNKVNEVHLSEWWRLRAVEPPPGPGENGYDTLESGSPILSRDRFSASIPNLNSAAAAISIRIAATA